jgi:hypothetical protein
MTNSTHAQQRTTQPAQPSSQALQPNLFELQGDGVTLSYSTSSIAGVPQFSYQDKGQTVSRSGEEIRTQETELATLVTINVEQIPDAREVTVTLFLPRIVLHQGSTETALATIGVLTTSARRVEGQMQSYHTLNLSGTARLVDF